MKVLTIFFTLAVARLLSVRVRVSIPKSDRLSNEKEKKRYASFLSAKRLRVKVARLLRVREKKLKKFFEVERNLRVCLIDCFQIKEAVIVKKEKKQVEQIPKIKKVTTNGVPSFDAYTNSEQKTLFSTLLVFITEYYKDKGSISKK